MLLTAARSAARGLAGGYFEDGSAIDPRELGTAARIAEVRARVDEVGTARKTSPL